MLLWASHCENTGFLGYIKMWFSCWSLSHPLWFLWGFNSKGRNGFSVRSGHKKGPSQPPPSLCCCLNSESSPQGVGSHPQMFPE